MQRSERIARFLQGDESVLPEGSPIAKVALTLYRDAVAGDHRAAAKLLDAYSASDRHDRFELPGLDQGSLADRAGAVLAAIGAGVLPASVGNSLLASLESLARISVANELADRVAQLEQRAQQQPDRLLNLEDLA